MLFYADNCQHSSTSRYYNALSVTQSTSYVLSVLAASRVYKPPVDLRMGQTLAPCNIKMLFVSTLYLTLHTSGALDVIHAQ